MFLQTMPPEGAELGARPVAVAHSVPLDARLTTTRRDLVFMAAVLIVSMPVRFYEAATHRLPFGFAGLFTLMAQGIADHGYRIPASLPYYGPGGVVFAYPPLAFYVMALAHSVFSVPTFTYLRFAPLVFTALYIIPLYLVYKTLSLSPTKALLATGLAATSPDILVYHEFADGVVRAFAFLCTCWGLWFTLRAFRQERRADIVLSSLFFAATILSHLANALFFALTAALLLLLEPGARAQWRAGVAIGIGGMLLSAPWWATIAHRDGIVTFVHALHSHNASVSGGSQPAVMLHAIATQFLPVAPLWYPEYAVALITCVYLCSRRRWFLPTWLAIVVFMPDAPRFVGIIVALLAATGIVDARNGIVRMRASRGRAVLLRAWFVAVSLSLSLLLAAFLYWAINVRPLLSPADISTAAWMRSHTPRTATFLVVTGQRERAEWFPYLLRRTPVIAEWGAEWTGRVAEQHALFDDQAGCVRRQSLLCLDGLLRHNHLRPDYLILDHRRSHPRLYGALERSGSWSLAFQNAGDAVWLKSSSSAALEKRSWRATVVTQAS